MNNQNKSKEAFSNALLGVAAFAVAIIGGFAELASEHHATTYDDAVRAICEGMSDTYYRQVTVGALKKDQNSEYYGSVVAVAKSDMDDFSKKRTIGMLG